MPCNSDYMEPHQSEKERREAAQVMVYIFKQERRHVPKALLAAAGDIYGEGHPSVVVELCQYLQSKGDEWIVDFAQKRIRHKMIGVMLQWWRIHCRDEGRLTTV